MNAAGAEMKISVGSKVKFLKDVWLNEAVGICTKAMPGNFYRVETDDVDDHGQKNEWVRHSSQIIEIVN